MYPGPKGTTGGVVAGGLAATGSNLGWWLAGGLALLIAGTFLLHTARRRLRRRATAGESES